MEKKVRFVNIINIEKLKEELKNEIKNELILEFWNIFKKEDIIDLTDDTKE